MRLSFAKWATRGLAVDGVMRIPKVFVLCCRMAAEPFTRDLP
jgi:hypothetical protein